ncbi:MAG: hypothetical protein ACE5JR_00330 [Gemmatimonadota bacterium]
MTARLAALAAVLLASEVAGCTEEALTDVPPDAVPGEGAETVELRLRASELPQWDDTTFSGFSTPSDAGILVAAADSTLQARILGRFSNIPDSVQIDTVRRAVLEFDSASIRLVLDTAQSVFTDSATALRVEVRALARRFEAREATWTEAARGESWSTPGGDLGALLGERQLEGRADTVRLALDAVDVDSLLVAWRDGGGGPGIAVVVGGPAGRLGATNLAIRMRARLEGIDSLFTVLRSASASTFIFDPPRPAAGLSLRVAGLPSSRAYVRFTPPERVGSLKIRGSTINRAEILLRPLPPSPDPYALDRVISSSVFRLLADPFVLGAKTPIGAALGLPRALDPDSLEAGEPLVFDVTQLLAEWAEADPASLVQLFVGFRSLPEGGGLGLWDFGSVEGPVDVEPVLRMLVTPSTPFRLP